MVAEKWNPNPGSGWTKRAKSLLSNSKIPAIRQVGVEWNSVGVVLRGQVHLYYYKQLAQELGYTGALDGSAEMNTWLHRQVMTKLAQNGGKVPAELRD